MLSRSAVSYNAREETSRKKIAVRTDDTTMTHNGNTYGKQRSRVDSSFRMEREVIHSSRKTNRSIVLRGVHPRPLKPREPVLRSRKKCWLHARVGTNWQRRNSGRGYLSALVASPRKTVHRESLSRPEGIHRPQNRTIANWSEREVKDSSTILFSRFCSFITGYFIYFACLSIHLGMSCLWNHPSYSVDVQREQGNDWKKS